MTREEAHNKMYDVWSDEIHYRSKPTDVMNEVYDDFESRTCENCKYANICPDGGNTSATVNDCEMIKLTFYDYEDFGCNKFERKQ